MGLNEIAIQGVVAFAFVTGNTKDFADEKGSLHPELADDLERAGRARDAVVLFDSLHGFVDAEFHRNYPDTLPDSRPEKAKAWYY